jgi:hypothetical protein
MQTTNASPAPKKRVRWWIPAIIISLTVANIVRARTPDDLDTLTRNFQTLLTLVASSGLLLLWWLFLSRLRWRVRLAGLGVVLLVALGMKLLQNPELPEGKFSLTKVALAFVCDTVSIAAFWDLSSFVTLRIFGRGFGGERIVRFCCPTNSYV